LKQTTNIIERLVAAPVGSPLMKALEQRTEILRLSQASHDAVVAPKEPGGFSHAERAALAERMARINNDMELAAHYRARLDEAGGTDILRTIADPSRSVEAGARLDAAVRYTDLVTKNPRDATRANIEELRSVGISDPDIVRLTELLAFVNYQARVIAGLKGIGRL
jgi:uncharacterized protein YciW